MNKIFFTNLKISTKITFNKGMKYVKMQKIDESESVIGQKAKMAIAVILAILLTLLLAQISYMLFPNQPSDQMPIPRPAPSMIDQIVETMLWIGLAAFIAIAIVGAVLLTNRIRNKEAKKQKEHVNLIE
jgi:TRAP-type C4-dicarboxylate transport system permease small subunit